MTLKPPHIPAKQWCPLGIYLDKLALNSIILTLLTSRKLLSDDIAMRGTPGTADSFI